MKRPFALLGMTLLLSACGQEELPPVEPDFEPEETPEELIEEGALIPTDDSVYFEAQLTDVTGGKASGVANASYGTQTQYLLSAYFTDLPPLEEGYFYEGWVLRLGEEPSVISTEVVFEDEDGLLINLYSNDGDLTDHTKYILTLEPDDGNPEPAEHVLEGDFALVQ